MTASAIPVLTGVASTTRSRTSGLKVLAQNILLHHEHGREFLDSQRPHVSSFIPNIISQHPGGGGLSFDADLAIKELAQTRSLSFELRLDLLALLALLVELIRNIESG